MSMRGRPSLAAALCRLAVFVLPLVASPLAAQGTPPTEARVWQVKVALRAAGAEAAAPAAAICNVRLTEGTSKLGLVCDHDLGSAGEISLVRLGTGDRPGDVFWSAPLASPFEATVSLSDDALAGLFAGELALRVESIATGVVVTGEIGTPIFNSSFEGAGLCEWSNFPCASDGNICTTEVCSDTGACQHKPNTLACPLPNATGGCFLGGCVISSCNTGYSSCDLNNTNGCEVNHNSGPGTCSNLVNYVGAYAGDTVCGAICTSNLDDITLFATRTGLGEAFYSAEAQEYSTCLGSTEHRIELEVPAGVDYDLYLYRDCKLVAVSNATTGVMEVLYISEAERAVLTEDFVYQVEVRWFSGRSCEPWTLKFYGYACG